MPSPPRPRLLVAGLLAVLLTPGLQQFFNLPLFYWPLPDEFRVITSYPDSAWTWEFLGLAPGMGCPGYNDRDPDASRAYWRTPGVPEDQDWTRASQGHRKLACYRNHAGTDIFAPPGTPVFAIADGTVTQIELASEEDSTVGVVVEIEHERLYRGRVYHWLGRYIHLKGNPPVTLGPVKGGQLIGYVVNQGTNSHLHMEFDEYSGCEKPCITNPWGMDVLWIDYDDDARIDPATDALEDAAPLHTLIANASFDEGLTHWAASPGAAVMVQEGVLRFSRKPGTDIAFLQQMLPYRVAADTPILVRLRLGNPTSATAYVGVSLREPDNWLGGLVCVFALPPESAPAVYRVAGTVRREWRNALLHLSITPAIDLPGVTIDDVWASPDSSVISGPTRCLEPAS
jgi:hypothetical protein